MVGRKYEGSFKNGESKKDDHLKSSILEVNLKGRMLKIFSSLLKEPKLNEVDHLLRYILEIASVDGLKARDIRVWEEKVENGKRTGRFRIMYSEPWLDPKLWKELKEVEVDVNTWPDDGLRKLYSGECNVYLVPNAERVVDKDPVAGKLQQKSFVAFLVKNSRGLLFSVGYDEEIPEEYRSLLIDLYEGLQDFVKTVFNIDNLFTEMRRLSYVDPLMNIYNRNAFNELLGLDYEKDTPLWKQVKSGNKTVVLLLLDLDKFKQVNDAYGHDVGDKILRYLGEVINQLVEKYNDAYREVFIPVSAEGHSEDRVFRFSFKPYRYGIGDEICIVAEVSSNEKVEFTSEKVKETLKEIMFCMGRDIRKRLRSLTLRDIGVDSDEKLPIDLSAGVAAYDGESSVKHLFRVADGRVYSAKKNKDHGYLDDEHAIVLD